MEMSGVIALQIHGKCKTQVSYRNIVIETLPDALVPEERQVLVRFGGANVAHGSASIPLKDGVFGPERDEVIVLV